MIIRRRTYSKKITERYGYFMRNTTFVDGMDSANYYSGHLNNIYTKCFQLETPVLQFNKRTNTTVSNGSHTASAACGYTQSSTGNIIIATAKEIYKSTGEGQFTQICTYNTTGYTSFGTGPIVYVNSSYCYVLYTLIVNPNATSNIEYQLKIFRCTLNGQSGTTFHLATCMASPTGMAPFSTEHGAFYSCKPSPQGQIIIGYAATSTQNAWIGVNIPNLCCSQPIYIDSSHADSYTLWGFTGQWYYDGTSYGAFFLTNLAAYPNQYEYYKISNSNFSSSTTLTKAKLNLGIAQTQNIDSYGNYPIIHVANNSNSNIIFIATFKNTNLESINVYTATTSFGSITKRDFPSNWATKVKGNNQNRSSIISGIYVTPDNKYAVGIYAYGAWVYNLKTYTYFDGFCFADQEGTRMWTSGDTTSFMLPTNIK